MDGRCPIEPGRPPARRGRCRRHRRRATRASTRPASWPAAAWRSPLLEAHTLGWGASTRNGGIVHAGYKWGAAALVKRYGETTGRALYRETLDSYALVKRLIADEAIDCDFREVGHLELAYAPSHVADLEHARDEPRLGRCRLRRSCPRERIREEIGSDAYYGALVVRRQRPPPPGSLLRRPRRGRGLGPGRTCTRASARRRSGKPGRRPVRRRDRARRDPGPGRVRRHERLHGRGGARRLRRRVIPIGSYIIASEPLPEDLARELSPKGRAFFDTKNFLYYWHVSADRRMVFGGRASFLPTSIDRTAAILHKGLLEVHPQLADYRIEYAWGGNVGFTFDRMPHVGRTKDGVTYALGLLRDRRRADDPPRHEGRRLAGRRRGAGPEPSSKFPLVPAPYEGRPWFLPFAGEWFRLQDRLAARSRPAPEPD